MVSANAYPTGSVFTVKPWSGEPTRRLETVAGWVDAPSWEPWFHVAVVQFNDEGTLVEPSQLDAAVSTVRRVRESTPNGAIVVVFVHGWHHSAAWNRAASVLASDADGDAHFHSFRLLLESLAIREMERPNWRRVVGVCLGWNGDPVGGALGAIGSVPYLTHGTFWDRYPVADRIGAGSAFRDVLRQIIGTTKDPIASGGGAPTISRPESPLVMIGHSMGALMLESGLLALLEDANRPLIRQSQATGQGAVKLDSAQGPVSFPDLILALNSAADSRIAKSIHEALAWHKLEKTAAGKDVRFSPPVMMSVTSSADTDTRDMWRLAQGLFAPWRKTDGHDDSLFTHDFVLTAADAVCRKQPDVRDFGQNWHCLRRPVPLIGITPAIAVDLPVRERTGVNDEAVAHARYTITPRGDPDAPHLMWVFQVPADVIKDHNDIFNSKARSLILALIQISGAVASLAEDWASSFEPE